MGPKNHFQLKQKEKGVRHMRRERELWKGDREKYVKKGNVCYADLSLGLLY